MAEHANDAAVTPALTSIGSWVAAPPRQLPLRPAGPAQAELLVHFCGRPPGTGTSRQLPPDIAALSPDQRLDAILWTRALRGSPPFGATDQPMVCLSESPPAHLQWQLARQFPPWALLLHRQWAYDAGGGPAWYVRHEHYTALAPEQLAWAVRLDTRAGSPSDWLTEREWRIPHPPGATHVAVPDGAIAGVIVGDPRWTPSVRTWWQPTGRLINSLSGAETTPDDPAAHPEAYPVPALPAVWPHIPHYWWNSTTQTLLAV